MPLDLEPILDLEPVAAPKLDLEPIAATPSRPEDTLRPSTRWERVKDALRVLGPGGTGAQRRELAMAPLVELAKHAPTAQEFEDATDVIAADILTGIDKPGAPGQGAQMAKDLLEGPSQAPGKAAQISAGATRAALGATEAMTSPLNIATMGVAAAPQSVQRAVSAGFAGQMLLDTPAAAQAAGAASVEGDLQAKTEAYAGLGLNAAMTVGAARHAAAEPRVIARPVPPPAEELPPAAPKARAETFSEFGGDKAEPLRLEPVETVQTPRPVETMPPAEDLPPRPLPAEETLPTLDPGARRAGGEIYGQVQEEVRQALLTPEPAASPAEMPAAPAVADPRLVARVTRRLAEDTTRAPDLIDEVQEQLGGRINIDSAKALQETFKSEGALKDVFGKDGEYSVDLARQAVDPDGTRFLSDEDFLTALRDADAARRGVKNVARREQAILKTEEQAALDVARQVDEAFPIPWDDIEAHLDSLKVDTRGSLHAFGLLPEAWNLLIDTVKLGVKAGKAINEAIDAAIAHVKEKFPDQALREEEARPFLASRFAGEPQRQYGEKVLASESVDPRVKERVSEYDYAPRRNETDRQLAERIIAERGMEQAVADYRNDTAMPEAVRSILGDTLLEKMAEQQQIAEKSGNKVESDRLVTQQVDLIDAELRRSTDLAQGLQAMRKYGLMSPAGMVRHAQKVIREATQKGFGTVRPVVDAIRNELKAGHEEAVDALTRDPAVNGAARAAVDETVRGSEETHRAVVMEITGAWAHSPVIVNTLRSQLHGKVESLTKFTKAGSQADVKARLNAMMSDVMDRIMTIANSHYQLAGRPGTGADFGRTLGEKIADRTGLSKKHSEEIAAKLDKEFAKMVEAAKGKLKQRIAMQRARQLEGMIGGEVNPVDRAIRQQLRQLNQRLGEAVRAGADEQLGRTIADRVVAESGLKGEAADRLRAVMLDRFQQLATEAKRRRLEALGKTISIPRKVRAAHEKLIEQSNLGAFSTEAAYNTVREKMGLPAWTPELAAEITRRANEVRTMPEGFQRQRAVIELLNHIERTKGLNWYDLPMGFWFANILSGATTHAKNMLSTGLNTAAHVGINIALQPSATPQILTALGRGFMKGVADARDVLGTGVSTGTRLQSLEASRALELKQFTGWTAPLNAWKYVFRAMAAEDLLFFKPAEEMKSALAARVIGRREKLSGKALADRVNEILGNVEARRLEAEAKAHSEGLTGNDFRRRVSEILEQGRPEQLRESARDYALRATFNGKPYGLLGVIARGLNSMRSEQPFLNTVVPFVNIVANVTNEGLNYLPPVGLTRAMYGHWSGKLEGKPIADRSLLHEQYAKAFLGTAAIAGVAVLAAKHQDEENPAFMVNGAGPSTPEQRKQLQGTGWIPYSFKIGGRYYSFANTPLSIPMAALGNHMDAVRYKGLDQTDALNRAAFAMATSGKVITEQSFLNGIADVFQLVDRQPGKGSAEAGARYVSRVFIGGATPNAVRQLDQFFDPTQRDAADVQAILIGQVPFVRRLNRPAINALGDPVQRYLNASFTTSDRGDDLLSLLAAKRAWPSLPDREVIVGDRSRGPDHYRMLDADEWYDYVQTSGQKIRERLETALPRLETMEPAAAKAYVQKVAEQERKRALRRFPR